MSVLEYERLYTIMVIIRCFLERENYIVSKFHLNNSSLFEIDASLFYAPRSNMHRTIKLRNEIEGTH